MSPTETARAIHPSASSQIESKLVARHVRFTFEANFPIEQIREVEGNQVRLSEHRAPKAIVDRYAEQMKGGAIFPGIVVNDRHELIDGNTRWMAAKRNGREAIAAYVCSDLSALQGRSLSIELNQCHGLSMTEQEIRAFVTGAVADGQVLDVNAYARMTGVKASTLCRWVAAQHFQMRAAREPIPSERLAALSDSVRAALNVAKLSAVFRAATALAVDARVPTAELKALVAEANTAPSEAAAVAVIEHACEVRSERVKAIAAGFKGARRKGAAAAPHIGGLLRFEISDLLDVPPEKQPDTFRRMTVLRERLDGALARASAEWELAGSVTQAARPVNSRDLAVAG
jgi:ParB-like chromosome segregation protein Spo0J